MATSAGRDGGLPGSGGPGATQARSDVGLMGNGPEGEKASLQGQSQPTDYAPNKEMQQRFGDVEKATPNQPIAAAKQAMEEERGQTFTSATGKPTQPSPTNM